MTAPTEALVEAIVDLAKTDGGTVEVRDPISNALVKQATLTRTSPTRYLVHVYDPQGEIQGYWVAQLATRAEAAVTATMIADNITRGVPGADREKK